MLLNHSQKCSLRIHFLICCLNQTRKQQNLWLRPPGWIVYTTDWLSFQATVPRRYRERGKSAGQPMRSHTLTSRCLPLIYINTSVIRVFCPAVLDKQTASGQRLPHLLCVLHMVTVHNNGSVLCHRLRFGGFRSAVPVWKSLSWLTRQSRGSTLVCTHVCWKIFGPTTVVCSHTEYKIIVCTAVTEVFLWLDFYNNLR